jgi:hypothetical protein
MMDVYYLLAGLAVRFPCLGVLVSSGSPFNTLLPAATPTPTTTGGGDAADAGNIRTFFTTLTTDTTIFALAMAGFFFALSALLYMASGATGNERTRQHALSALYATLGGLALALLSGSIAALVNNAAGGK